MRRVWAWLSGRPAALGRLELALASATARGLSRLAPDALEVLGGVLVAFGIGLIYLPAGIIAAGLGLIAYVHGGTDDAETS